VAGQAGGRLVPYVRGWALWTARPAVVCWVATVVAGAAGLAVAGLWRTPLRGGELATWLVFAGCGAVCVEAVRRVGEAAGASNDLLSAWTLPVALVLPPVWSLLIPALLTTVQQLRIGRGPVYRRLYSVAAIGLSNWVVSVGTHRALGAQGLQLAGHGPGARTAALGMAFGWAAIGCAVNVALIGTAVRLSTPQVTWRQMIVDREQRVLDVGEISLGVVVAVCWLVSPLLAVAMLAPALLVQRSLTHAQLRAAARLDAKTGLLNALAWQDEAEREIVRARRDDRPVAVLIADIDHFKHVNDTHGHLNGGVALRATVTALLGQLRPYDQLGRFGGEEFTVVLPGAGRTEAADVAERLRRAVAAGPVVLAGREVYLSVSVGVAVLGDHGTDLTDLLAAADHALFVAKDAGRNRVALAS